MKIDHALRYSNPDPLPRRLPTPIARRHKEFIEHLGSIGLTPYRISVAIGKNHRYVDTSIEQQSEPRDETIEKYVETLYLNRNWIKIGRGEMISDPVALLAFAASVAHKRRSPADRPAR